VNIPVTFMLPPTVSVTCRFATEKQRVSLALLSALSKRINIETIQLPKCRMIRHNSSPDAVRPQHMKARFAFSALALLIFAAVSPAEPTPAPKRAKGKEVVPARQDAKVPAAVALFILQLRPDGSVQKVLIGRSTGNHSLDAITAKGLSAMRFPDAVLTKEERSKREKILQLPVSEELLKSARYLPNLR
jgi:hypothetical protein